jgi:hypothetical protein
MVSDDEEIQERQSKTDNLKGITPITLLNTRAELLDQL